jgi:hypothetical protein
MRNIQTVQINELFVHIVDNRKPELVLSDYPVQLDDLPGLRDYFAEHIRASLADSITRAARFSSGPDCPTAEICANVLAGRLPLVEGSRQLAQRLYEITKANRSISPADLAVCTYQDAAQPQGPRYLAILKIDPSKGFTHRVEDINGKKRISFEDSSRTLTQEKLQKSAFVQPLEPRHPEYDLLLLDRQTGAADPLVRIFFARTFLNVVDALDPTRRTEIFYKTIMDQTNAMIDVLPEEVRQEIDQRLTAAVTGATINVTEWLAALPVDAGLRETFRSAIQEKIADQQFETDPRIGGKLAARIQYIGEDGLYVSAPNEIFNRRVKWKKVSAPGGDIIEVTIRTKTWKQVSR